MKPVQIKRLLDRLYEDYNYQERIYFDPVEFPHRYKNTQDIEVVSFISTCLAYGQVSVFKGVLERIFSKMGASPYDFLTSFDVHKHGGLFRGIKYRFNTNDDILGLLNTLAIVLRRHGSLRRSFLLGFSNQHENTIPALSVFVDTLLSINTTDVYGSNLKPAGYTQFFPRPSAGSPCKRMNLLLRWMVREGNTDFGLWSEVPKDRLLIPLDTHIARISRCIGLTRRATADLKMAIEITETLRGFDPEDPVKYDFALCHQGISRLCSPNNCKGCYLKRSL